MPQKVHRLISYSKAEIKGIVKAEMVTKWQGKCNWEIKGRHFYKIQKKVGEGRKTNRSRKEEGIISRILIILIHTQKVVGMHTKSCLPTAIKTRRRWCG